MKVIIYTRPDGGVSVCRPNEGARLAFFITLADGERLPSGVAPFIARPVDTIRRVWPVAGAVAEWAESEEQFVERIKARSVPGSATNVQVVDAAAIPLDRTFRDSWRMDARGGITHDMTKAREIHREKLRALRRPKFEALDCAWMKSLAAGDTTAAQAAEVSRQELRDAPQYSAIDDAATPEQLKEAIPPCLS